MNELLMDYLNNDLGTTDIDYEEKDFPVNPHFLDFIEDWNSKFYFLVGGYGSSKSYHVATKIVKKALEEKRKILVVREVYDTIRDSCYSLLNNVCRNMGLVDGVDYKPTKSPLNIKFLNSGSEIIFKGMDKPEKVKSIDDISIIWLEECSEIKYSGFKELKGRLRHNTLSNHIILSSNPVSKNNWIYKEFFYDKNAENEEDKLKLDDKELYKKRIIVKDNIYYHHSTVDDNYFVPAEYVEELDKLKKSDKDLWRVARLGHFGASGKIVLPNFKRAKDSWVQQQLDTMPHLLYKNGMDFGFVTSYNALVKLAIDKENRDLYIYDEYYSRGKTDIEISKELEDHVRKDELIKGDCAEPKAIRFYKQQGFNMKACKKFQGSRTVYTQKVRRFNNIYCSDKCIHCIEELEELTFAEDKNGEILEDEFNIDPHTLDHMTWRSKIAV